MKFIKEKVKAFWYVFYKSLTSIEYYKDVIQEKPSFALKYFAILMLFTAIFTALINIRPSSPKVEAELNRIIDQGVELFPNDLVIKAENGSISVNKPEPFEIAFEDGFGEGFVPSDSKAHFPKNLIVFDRNGTINDLDKLDTLVLVNDKNIITRNNGRIEAQPTSDIPDGEMNKADIQRVAVELKGYTKYVSLVLFLVTIFAGLFYFVWLALSNMVFLLGIATILFFIGTWKGLTLGFGKYYQISIHAVTLPAVLTVVYELIVNVTPFDLYVGPGVSITVFAILNVLYGALAINLLAKQNKE